MRTHHFVIKDKEDLVLLLTKTENMPEKHKDFPEEIKDENGNIYHLFMWDDRNERCIPYYKPKNLW